MQLRCKRCGSDGRTENGPVRGKQRYRCMQGLRAELHRHAAARPAPGAEGHRRAALRQRPVDEPQRPSWSASRPRPCRRLDRAARRGLRAKARAAAGAGAGDRARRDAASPQKSPTGSGCGRLGIVRRGGAWTGSAAVAIELPSSGRRGGWSAGGPGSAAPKGWEAYAEPIPPTPAGSTPARTRRTGSSERDHARQGHTGSPASGAARSWSPRPSAWSTPPSPCSPPSAATIRSRISCLS